MVTTTYKYYAVFVAACVLVVPGSYIRSHDFIEPVFTNGPELQIVVVTGTTLFPLSVG